MPAVLIEDDVEAVHRAIVAAVEPMSASDLARALGPTSEARVRRALALLVAAGKIRCVPCWRSHPRRKPGSADPGDIVHMTVKTTLFILPEEADER